jgi:hypothetical protein
MQASHTCPATPDAPAMSRLRAASRGRGWSGVILLVVEALAAGGIVGFTANIVANLPY